MTDKEIRLEAMKPDSDISSGRYAFLAQIRLVFTIVIWGLVAESGIIGYGIARGNLHELGSVITSVALAAGTISGIISLLAFGGKVGQTVAENKYNPPPSSGQGGQIK